MRYFILNECDGEDTYTEVSLNGLEAIKINVENRGYAVILVDMQQDCLYFSVGITE
jgi:hypothetical protein